MNKYIVPINDSDGIYIESVSARSLSEAEDKFMEIICQTYDYEPKNSWYDFINMAWSDNITIGEIRDIEEF